MAWLLWVPDEKSRLGQCDPLKRHREFKWLAAEAERREAVSTHVCGHEADSVCEAERRDAKHLEKTSRATAGLGQASPPHRGAGYPVSGGLLSTGMGPEPPGRWPPCALPSRSTKEWVRVTHQGRQGEKQPREEGQEGRGAVSRAREGAKVRQVCALETETSICP